MISKIENIIALRYLKPKRKEGFLKVISIFSFTGIALGVAILIIVMSVMNGFRAELISKILGFNPHIIIKPYEKKIDITNIKQLDSLSEIISNTMFSFSGQGILISGNNTQGILVRSYFKKDLRERFPQDIIEDIPKGKEGADLELHITLGNGNSIGMILIERKSTKTFSQTWIKKFVCES